MVRLGQLTLVVTALLGQAHARLLFEDDFNGGVLDATKWVPQPGDGCDIGLCGWGNGEAAYYTSDSKNVRVEDGVLKLQILADRSGATPFSSGKIRTYGLFDFTYGRVETRMKMPAGATGVWPAFWMLPAPLDSCAGENGCGEYGTWASSGEIDILEVSNGQECATSALHFAGEWPNNRFLAKADCANDGRSLDDDFHDYAMEWTSQQIRWYIDGRLYHAQSDYYSQGGAERFDAPAPFNLPFHLILNVAVGGAGTAFTGFQQPDRAAIDQLKPTLEVDFVRVYDMENIEERVSSPPIAPASFHMPSSLVTAPAGQVIFEDDFGASGPIDESKWAMAYANGCDLGLCDWGNNERQFYTRDASNARNEDGLLKITVKNDRAPGRYAFTSAKLQTLNKFDFVYGSVEARIRMPEGAQGIWPAFRMLPSPTGIGASCYNTMIANEPSPGCGDYGTWAASGAIDVAQTRNGENTMDTSIHYGSQWPDQQTDTSTRDLTAGFHVYRLEWTPEGLQFYMDGEMYHELTEMYSVYEGQTLAAPAPFDKPFHLVVGVAVGGGATAYTGYQGADAARIAEIAPTMEVDYVRVTANEWTQYATPFTVGGSAPPPPALPRAPSSPPPAPVPAPVIVQQPNAGPGPAPNNVVVSPTVTSAAACEGVAACGVGSQMCMVDDACANGGAGCIGGETNCRYCGFGTFEACSTTTTTPAVIPPSASVCSAVNEQCGGKKWKGATCCDAGSECVKSTKWYSSCKPTSFPASGCAATLGQCGGKKFDGPDCCESDADECVKHSKWYSKCEPVDKSAYTPVCQAKGLQCGGKKYDGPHCCEEGLECVKKDFKLHKCKAVTS